MNAQTVNQATKAGTAKAERDHLATLEKIYLRLISAAGRRAAEAFVAQTTLVAAVNPKWVPPTTQLIDAEQLTADAQRKTARPHELILRDVTAADEIGITWDINHPTSQQLLANVASRLESLNAALRLQVSETIQDGYAQGWSVARTAAAIVEKVDEVAPGRAETYARTDLVALSNGGSLMAAQIVGVAAKTWLATEDERTRETHAQADGQTVGLEQPFDIGGEQGMYPGDPDLSDEEAFNCFPAETAVEMPALQAVMRRWYEGDLVRVRLASGDELSGTPNHPILRADGRWIAIADLQEGDHLVSARLGGDYPGAPHPERRPVSIGEIYRLANIAADAQRVGLSPPDLHGDGADGEVEVVTVEGSLLVRRNPASNEEIAQVGLTLADLARSVDGSGDGSLGMLDEARQLSQLPTSRIRFGREHSSLALVELPHPDVVGSRSTSDRQSHLGQPPADSWAPDTESDADGQHTVAPVVSLTEIIEIKREAFQGFVYNLDTGKGWYTAGSVVAGNCRCTITYGDDLTAAAVPQTERAMVAGMLPIQVMMPPQDPPTVHVAAPDVHVTNEQPPPDMSGVERVLEQIGPLLASVADGQRSELVETLQALRGAVERDVPRPEVTVAAAEVQLPDLSGIGPAIVDGLSPAAQEGLVLLRALLDAIRSRPTRRVSVVRDRSGEITELLITDE